MKLSTRGRYGIRALLDIALQQGARPVILREIAQRQQISPLYLQRLIAPLIGAGVVRSIRGARGGITLARPPQDIKLSEVFTILEGSVLLADCIGNPTVCDRSESCVTRDIWAEMKDAINRVLENVTLQDLIERQNRKEGSTELIHYS